MTHRPPADTFLRAALKTGLRLQRGDSGGSGGSGDVKGRAGVQTLERIKASLRKNRNPKRPL